MAGISSFGLSAASGSSVTVPAQAFTCTEGNDVRLGAEGTTNPGNDDGVSGTLLTPDPSFVPVPGDVAAGDVFVINGARTEYVQMGWAYNNGNPIGLQQGLRYFVIERPTTTSPELVTDKGPASTSQYHTFKLQQNLNPRSTGNYLHYFAYLDGTLVWESQYAYDTSLWPEINAETNNPCSEAFAQANGTGGWGTKSLQVYQQAT
ncbi:MAG: hypothetical protein ACREPI_08545, partial [Candidatus Dormibacterales bacterium]